MCDNSFRQEFRNFVGEQASSLEMGRMGFLRIFGFGCEITKYADSDIDKSSHEQFSVNKNVGIPAVLHGFQLSNSKH